MACCRHSGSCLARLEQRAAPARRRGRASPARWPGVAARSGEPHQPAWRGGASILGDLEWQRIVVRRPAACPTRQPGQPARHARPSSHSAAKPSPVRLSRVPRRLAPSSLARRGVLPAGPGRHPAVVINRKATLAELLPSCWFSCAQWRTRRRSNRPVRR
jgi:hypothetical protein